MYLFLIKTCCRKICNLNPANDFRNAKISIFHYQDWQKAITDIRFLAIVVALLYYFKQKDMGNCRKRAL
ncbi:hypothetical protein KsCSTR_17060 [Candidatus Kuenenia stuttgartiensis]|uniref:Uncharacterized protein n=1 Tax=Kuenenia stuttgartiensis TaxID=174633 RepID=Q1Q213_KUEST|nr:hypothetical protein KsCSTR_17060 [Candidatus Kuenenia stuttgartiensis]CAJ74054.1 hypothetical protein kuste3294 [Candidatus Kuenenia stuttgartiensis]